MDWPGFWDQFQTSIHSSSGLSDIDPFNYLKKYLCGSAAACVSGLTLSSQNYKVAISILQKKFLTDFPNRYPTNPCLLNF